METQEKKRPMTADNLFREVSKHLEKLASRMRNSALPEEVLTQAAYDWKVFDLMYRALLAGYNMKEVHDLIRRMKDPKYDTGRLDPVRWRKAWETVEQMTH